MPVQQACGQKDHDDEMAASAGWDSLAWWKVEVLLYWILCLCIALQVKRLFQVSSDWSW